MVETTEQPAALQGSQDAHEEGNGQQEEAGGEDQDADGEVEDKVRFHDLKIAP